MKNIDKIKLSEITYANESHTIHFHLHYEIIYIIEGTVKISYDSGDVFMQKGNICIIPPLIAHKVDFFGAEITQIIFDYSYLTKYISSKALKSFTSTEDAIIMTKNNNDGTITDLIRAIKLYEGKGAYIFLLKLMKSGSPPDFPVLKANNPTTSEVIASIKTHIKEKTNLSVIASECHLSKFHVCRLVKKEFDITPVEYINFLKIRTAVFQLLYSKSSIAKISRDLSFSSPKYFTKIFKSYFGISPSGFRRDKVEIFEQTYCLKQ